MKNTPNTTSTFKGNSECQITKLTTGREERVVPLAMELDVKNGSDLADIILANCHWKEFVRGHLERDNEGVKWLQRLQEDSNGAELKITIKIELEKYE